ncbi:sulfatase family protein [Carboxylicivirga marina]|uniref:Sulfatase n=1 Tax=Carboxylicivirga marina TaxID=2800988 RepID=A0ABS1HES4_9BACT|nr:sulfatase [Carboxylicivirga marina]MBK3516174.1 sulfatase [Carboxylicivirga marina]
MSWFGKIIVGFIKAFIFFGFCCGIENVSAQTEQQPNIIWIMAEDIGPDIECYGMPAVKTPELNRLAESGLLFTNAYCTNSICSPSRSAMMTGVHQNKINAQHHRSNRDVNLDQTVQPFTYHLRNAGYTCILGHHAVMKKGRKIDVNYKHKAIGEWDGVNDFGLFDKFDRFNKDDQPFFNQIQLVVTHRGDWWDEVRQKSKYKVNPDSVIMPPYMADDSIVRLDWAKYLDQLEYMDNEVGMIVQELKEKGLYENTVIIFIGDNGRCNIRGKGYLFDPGLHIPLIVHWPEGIASGALREELVSTTDITATILDLAGAEMPKYLTGQSFMQDDFEREYVYSARDLWDEVKEQSRSLYDGQHKYIRNDMPEQPYDATQAYLEFYRPALHVMRKLKQAGQLNPVQALFFENDKPKEQLFDLKNDPHEQFNLALQPHYEELLVKMRKELQKKELEMTSADDTFWPIQPKSVETLKWVKAQYPLEYQEMLNGKEIGFQKYSKLYKQYNQKK